ncbi:MAG: hypothetical protein Q9173_001102 [Seirophora scorigena]
MTVEKCAAACTKFPLFGVEYGTECYCGNTLNQGSDPAPEEECSFKCPGNPDEKCGAGNRLNVYEKLVTAPVITTPTVSTYQAEGCYTEANNGRALTGKTFYDDAMTTAKCASACAGFDLFGLDGTTVTPPISTPKSYVFDGCFTEATNSRALTGSVYYDNEMTVERCSAVCKAYALFGVEFGRECYCGDTLQAGSEKTLESECNFPCPGNNAEFCGAGNRLNVYHFGAATTSSSSVSTSSSATSSSAASSSLVTTSTETPVSTEMATTSTEVSTSSTEIETFISSTETSTTSTETPVTSTETSVTSIESPATSTETSTTSTETSITSTEIPTSNTEIETFISSTETSTTSTEIETSFLQSRNLLKHFANLEIIYLVFDLLHNNLNFNLLNESFDPFHNDHSHNLNLLNESFDPFHNDHSHNLNLLNHSFDPFHNDHSHNLNLLNHSFDPFHNDHSHNLNLLNDFSDFSDFFDLLDFFHNNFYRKQNLEYNNSDYHVIDIGIIGLHSFTHSGYCQPLFRTGRRLRALRKSMDFHWYWGKCSPDILYGRTQSISSLSQTVSNLIRGKTYTLRYFYNVEQASTQAQCTFSVSIRDRVVDSFTSPTARSDRYISRSVTYENLDTTPAALSFMLTCPSFSGQNGNNYALDAITLVTDRNGCS